jgi:hypothetical protein
MLIFHAQNSRLGRWCSSVDAMSAKSLMSTILPRSLAAYALIASAGCAENNVSFFIRQMQRETSTGMLCTTSNMLGGVSIFEGILDLAFKPTYNLSPLLQNNIFARTDPTAGRAPAGAIIVEGYVIEVRRDSPEGELLTGPGFSNPFTVYQTSFVPTGAAGVGGFTATTLEAIPPQIGSALFEEVCRVRQGIVPDPRPGCGRIYNTNVQQRLMLGVYAFGHTNGGVSVQTPIYNFPVNTCCGCLVNFPPSTMPDAGAGAATNCNIATNSVINCTPGQDEPYDCGLCVASHPFLCQPRGHVFIDGAGPCR